jgi:hypothetical protein
MALHEGAGRAARICSSSVVNARRFISLVRSFSANAGIAISVLATVSARRACSRSTVARSRASETASQAPFVNGKTRLRGSVRPPNPVEFRLVTNPESPS